MLCASERPHPLQKNAAEGPEANAVHHRYTDGVQQKSNDNPWEKVLVLRGVQPQRVVAPEAAPVPLFRSAIEGDALKWQVQEDGSRQGREHQVGNPESNPSDNPEDAWNNVRVLPTVSGHTWRRNASYDPPSKRRECHKGKEKHRCHHKDFELIQGSYSFNTPQRLQKIRHEEDLGEDINKANNHSVKMWHLLLHKRKLQVVDTRPQNEDLDIKHDESRL